MTLPPPQANEQDYRPPQFTGGAQKTVGQQIKRGVQRLLVSVYWDDAPADITAKPGVAKFVQTARELARGVVRELVDWTRVQKEQVWLPEHIQDIRMTHPGSLFNDESGELLPIVVGLPIDTYDRADGSEIDAEFVALLREKLAIAADVPLPELLLADALHFVRRLRRPEVQRGVLLAAIATELKVKKTLRDCAGNKLPLVELILDNPRDVSVAAANLFHKAMRATVGRSLQQEKPDQFTSVERLFKLRNDIAHGGVVPDAADGRAAVSAAREAFHWLEDVAEHCGK